MMEWRNNILAKILSLVAAIGLWVYVMSEQNPIVEVTYTVPVHLENKLTNHVVEGYPDSVKVTLSGPRNRVLQLDPNSLEATINLKGMQVGEHKVKLDFVAPSSFSTVNISPDITNIYIDENAVKYVPISFKPMDKLASDIELNHMQFVPDKVAISGASRLVHAVKSAVITGKVEDRVGQHELKGNITLYDYSDNIVRNLEVIPAHGLVKFDLVKIKEQKMVDLVPQIKGNSARGFVVHNIEVNPKSVQISGAPDALANLHNIQLEPVDINGLKGEIEKTMSLRLPNGVTSNIGEAKVTINIEKSTD